MQAEPAAGDKVAHAGDAIKSFEDSAPFARPDSIPLITLRDLAVCFPQAKPRSKRQPEATKKSLRHVEAATIHTVTKA
jgi:hypothetical protein